MEELKLLRKCDLCERSDEDLSLLSANHKDLGWIKICNDCWSKLYARNRMVAGSTGSSKNSGSACRSCPNPCY